MQLQNLKKLRVSRKLTCQDVADQIGITKNYYWMIERGDRGLSYELAVQIAQVFDLNPDDIFLNNKSTKRVPND
ncbi:helix-turn-helix domain-containing protein [Listeria booriae]|uniref:helix-turn-helix domain-containing protein n=1 Tax=Listeria booriae TaxID=1552123 RepID=UPI001623694F|nr:helix-turn-helix transcriptional regulator [Listeria booriae]MBC2391318.1 helix-turn-helix transcriptional regulator [Listeria booriae]